MYTCKQCGGQLGGYLHIPPLPDDCPYCGHPIRWANRTDGRNLRARFDQWKRAQLRYPDPPTQE